MANETQKSIFKKVISVNDQSGDLKTQYSIDLSPWDSSLMDGYVPGSQVHKGYSCKIATLKPNKKFPKSRVDIDPANAELRKAIEDMYKEFDKVNKAK